MIWYKTWFDSKYYHILYKNRNHTEASNFIHTLTDYLSLPKGKKVLDLACGRGRHSVHLHQLGYEVTGLDLSANSIAYAQQFAQPGLKFEVHDMLDLYCNGCFDAVFNLFTSFGYFEDENASLKVLQNVHNQLVSKGIFVIDFMNVKKAVAHLVPNETKTVDGIEFKIQREITNGFIHKTIHFTDEGETYDFEEFVKILDQNHFHELISQANFEILATFGGYDLTPFDVKNSDRLIFILQKK